MINQIDLPLIKRVYIDELIERANIFASNKAYQENAFCCYIAYEWHNLGPYNEHHLVILKYIIKESNFTIDIDRCINAIKKYNNGIQDCYNSLK